MERWIAGKVKDRGPPQAMTTIVYSSPFVPAEWIAAHGLAPSRRAPARAAHDAPEGACPFATAFMREASASAAPVVVASTCDPMRRGAGALPDDGRLLLMHVPSSSSPAAAGFYRGELDRLGRFLERHGGVAPSPDRLRREMRRFEDLRRVLAGWRGRMGAADLARRFARYHREGDPGPEPAATAPAGSGPAVLVAGGPLTEEDIAILARIESAGARIVADGTEAGERCWPRPYDEASMAADPLGELADAHFGAIPDVFRRPGDLLHRWVRETVSARGARGVIVVAHIACDLWRAAAAGLRDSAGVPVLMLDLRGGGGGAGAETTRVQAFVESLR